MSLTRRSILRSIAATAPLLAVPRLARAAEADLLAKAKSAIDRACAAFRPIGTRGGYLWSYSPDLRDRRGETKATATQIWVQPPGTPAIGMVFLRAYRLTKDPVHLDAARAAADALAYGQLESGGWHYSIDFDPRADNSHRRSLGAAGKGGRLKNITTFDDNSTQAATTLLMAVGEVTDGADQDRERLDRIESARKYALDGFCCAQYPNGAFAQAYMGAPRNPADYPLKPASVPKDWHDLPKVKEYWFHYTLNDNTHADCLRVLMDAHRRYKDDRFLAAARKAGDFLLSAVLPAPHPAWAQQYTPDMRPAWARKFEPPAACTCESANVTRVLVDLYLYTGDAKYLAPIPAALDWIDSVRLKDGRWPRFLELNTNRPLYMTRQYQVVYTDDDLPTHYGFQNTWHIPAARPYYEAVKAAGRDGWLAKHPADAKPKPPTEQRVADVIGALNDRGLWIDPAGRISCKVFVENMTTLCDYVEGAA